MIKFQHFVFTDKYWTLYKSRLVSWYFIFDICKYFGGFWLIIEPASYFSDQFATAIKPYGLCIFLLSIAIAVIQNKPRLKFKYFIKEKDVYINIVIGDLMKMKKKDLIIPANVHFITELTDTLISENSVQGQFTKKYYSTISHLDSDIENSLNGQPYSIEDPRHLGKEKRYDLGSVAKLSIKKDNIRLFWAYLFALAKFNEHGVCQSDMGEFQRTLPSLWNFIQTRGQLSDLAMPIIGSGYCRIDASREDLFKEILMSFLAATRNNKFCKSLTIVIYYKDISEMNIDLDSIKEFANYQTLNFMKESVNRNLAIIGQEVH